MLQVNVTFRHMETSDALRDYVRDKITKVERYLHPPIGAHVVLSVEKFVHHAEITVTAGGAQLRGTEKSEDMYSSIDLAMDKIERQAKRHKERTGQA
ncbi:MAG: ribosome-associated translation inhibitor RaiA [Deltaproteobacteria bacterium]|nr:ribosome-associated translation inhibitor RaiA [Deltaproteobacteria bacterium]